MVALAVLMRRGYVLLVVAFFIITSTEYNVTTASSSPAAPSSSSHRINNHSPPIPTASPTQLPSSNLSASEDVWSSPSLMNEDDAASLLSKSFLNEEQPQQTKPSSSLAFLYELYEHEIFNPKSNTWVSRRFTQSPTTGGGGRDSTSLHPQSCTPPRNYDFDGEWKIDMTDRDTRDGFGWEYYVGKYDGLGRRRRRWIRSLIRTRNSSSSSIGSISGSGTHLENVRAVSAGKKSATRRSSSGAGAKKTVTSRSSKQQHRELMSNVLRVLRDQYNFKGFGWSINKSLVHARAFGTTFRLPLSANFDSYDRYFAAPYISASTYFGYPWVAAALLNASLPIEAIRWIIDGVIWKLHWVLSVLSAVTRGVVELAIWVVFWPWRLWMATLQLMGGFTGRRPTIKKQAVDDMTKLVNSDVIRERDATSKSVIESGDDLNVRIETQIEIHDGGEMSATTSAATAAVIDSPRGGASNIAPLSFFAKKHLTVFGNEIPPFHRTTSLAYSSTIQERIGVAVSWRVSRQRGYEYRCNLFFTCMPTRLFWEQVDEQRKKHVDSVRRVVSEWKSTNYQSSKKRIGSNDNNEIEDKNTICVEAKSMSSSRPRSLTLPTALTSFLNDHSSTVGISGGWPMPAPPHVAFNLVLSMSGFFIGWLFTYIRSIFVLPLPNSLHHQSNDEKIRPKSDLSPISEKLVSSALKNKMRLEAGDMDAEIEDTDEDEEEPILNSS